MQPELAVRALIGWTALSVLAALAWSRFATRIRQREQELDGVPGPAQARDGGETSAASNRAKGAVADQEQLPRSA
jgi:hypothetical protein